MKYSVDTTFKAKPNHEAPTFENFASTEEEARKKFADFIAFPEPDLISVELVAFREDGEIETLEKWSAT